MAKYRHIYTSFWEDPKVSESFTPEDKFFFLYLLTNQRTTQCGIYKITKKLMAFEMGYSIESINSLIDRFQEHHKVVKYSNETCEIAIKNWAKFNLKNEGKPIIDCITPEVEAVEDKTLLLYVLDSIEKPKVKQVFINELIKAGLMKDKNKEEIDEKTSGSIDVKVDDTYDDSFYGTSTIGGQKENKKENENKNKKDNIYKKDNKAVDNVNNVDNFNGQCSPKDKNNDFYEEIVNAYNTICVSMPKVIKLTRERKKAIKSRWNEYKDLISFKKLFTKAEESNFLSGRDGCWTGCAFDWLLNSKNMLKVLEGNYDNKSTHRQQHSKISTFNDFKQRPDALETYKKLEKVMEEKQRNKIEERLEGEDGKAFIERLRNKSRISANYV